MLRLHRMVDVITEVARRFAAGQQGGASAYVASGVLIIGTLAVAGAMTGTFQAIATKIASLVATFVATNP